jgi:anti-anti-sigma regulatory factor
LSDPPYSLKSELEQVVIAALQRQALSNRGSVPPFRLATIGREFIERLFASLTGTDDTAYRYGEALGQQGLGLPSLLEAQSALIKLLVEARAANSIDAQVVSSVTGFVGQVVRGLVAGETIDLERQRADMERVYIASIAEQRELQAQMRDTIRELSTPIIPVYEGILVLPLVGSVDSRRATQITEGLLESIAAYQAEIVIMDITGVPVIDTSTANHLLMAARAANLLGSQVVLVGIGAEIAQTIVQLGLTLQGVSTLANLQAGIAYALEQIGLGIQPLKR